MMQKASVPLADGARGVSSFFLFPPPFPFLFLFLPLPLLPLLDFFFIPLFFCPFFSLHSDFPFNHEKKKKLVLTGVKQTELLP
ncbi:hypothetical protein OFB61_24735, partial [Escherichia coli]|nr:hypothetical protein [Escherichia coli]